jgi:UDP-glucose:glycoprotein glucosyltransferase
VFNNLPTSLLLTMHMDTPQSWVVQAIRSVYDLDNIMLKDMGKETRLSATFELQHILAEGKAHDTCTSQTTHMF